MNYDELLQALSATLSKSKVVKLTQLASGDDLNIKDLLALTIYPEHAIAFRAAWVLEHTEVKFPERFISYFPDFVRLYKIQNNPSCQRHFTKIVMRFTSSKISESRKRKLFEKDLNAIIETTFCWLINSKTPVAVQVNCIDILNDLKYIDAWIESELIFQIQHLLKNGTAAMQSRGKKILDTIKRK